MNPIWQVLLALLAAVGLLALGWLTFGRLLTPVGGGGGGPVYAVVPASGDGAHLEQDVKGLLWLRGGELARFTIVIADGGLDGTGRAVAAALLARGQGIVRPHHHQVEGFFFSKLRHFLKIHHTDVHAPGNLRDSRISRRAVKLLHLGALGQLPADGVLAAAAAHYQNFFAHFYTFS